VTEDTDKRLRLTSLEVENVLRLQAVELVMGDDDVLLIEAGNQQGKSSALKCVEMLFGGGKAIPPSPLHGDAKKGHIIARVGEFVVTQRFRAGKGPIFSVTLEGKKLARPREVMAKMLHGQTLNPLKLLEMDAKGQAECIASLMGFDSSELDAEYARLFEERKDAKKEAKRLIAAMNQAPRHTNAPEKIIDVAELQKEAKRRRAHNQEIESLQRRASEIQGDCRRLADECQAATVEIAKLRKTLREKEEKLAEREKMRSQWLQDLETARTAAEVESPQNVEEIEEQIAQADDLNRKRRDNDRHSELRGEANAAEAKWDKLEEDLKKVAEAKERARVEATKTLAIPDLTLTDDGVMYKGQPFSQAGRSAQLRVSVAVAMALGKGSTVTLLLIDDAEKLDAAGTRLVLEMAQEAGFQVMMTRVLREGPASEGAVVIEDGMTKEVTRA
jgi:hypothetical protein